MSHTLAPSARPPAATGADKVAFYRPHAVDLSGFTTLRRHATRPAHARNERFAAEFDDSTLFFDAVRAPDGRHIVLLGPSFFNLADRAGRWEIADDRGRPMAVSRIRHLDRHAQVWIAAPPEVRRLDVSCGLGRFPVAVAEDMSAPFAGRRVLLTKSRDNPLAWITDWIRFNRDTNGADAVLLYDNGSTRTSLDDLRAAIGSVAGIVSAAVVDWPFKFGPQGPSAAAFWDSDFCELGALEHARWAFLGKARSVMAGDIDELPFGATGVFEAAERSRFGVARYHGRWIVRCDGDAWDPEPSQRRHRHYGVALRPQPGRDRLLRRIDTQRCAPKWTVVPSRCPGYAQWHVHALKRWLPGYATRPDIGFAHFRPISTSWKYARGEGVAFDPALHQRDDALAAAMARVDWSR